METGLAWLGLAWLGLFLSLSMLWNLDLGSEEWWRRAAQRSFASHACMQRITIATLTLSWILILARWWRQYAYGILVQQLRRPLHVDRIIVSFGIVFKATMEGNFHGIASEH